MDLGYLSPSRWDSDLQTVLASARTMPGVQAFKSASCTELYAGALAGEGGADSSGGHNWLPDGTMQDPGKINQQAIVLKYRSNREYESFARVSDVLPDAWCALCTLCLARTAILTCCSVQQLGIITDIKANVPRTAYKGVVPLRHSGCLKLLVPATTS